MYAWQQRLFFYSVVSVIFTTLFAWFHINSFCIMLMVGSRYLYRPLHLLRTIFTKRIFLAYLAFCLAGVAGFLYTRNMQSQANDVAKEATLIAFALVFCLEGSFSAASYRKLLDWYFFLLLAASVYCLAVAVHNYRISGDSSVFFYHLLTRPIAQNAVFFSVYILFGLVFLLAPGGAPLAGRLTPNARMLLRYGLAAFYLGMLVLLNSKLTLVIGLLVLLNAIFRKYSFRTHPRPLLAVAAILIFLVCLLGMTDNPISRRFRELAAGDLAVVRQEKFNPGMYFNAMQLRLLEWRFGYEILHERNAWLVGVSPGDSQELLDDKYVAANMYIGNPADGPHRKVRGFIGYNFHNQYLETLVRSGLIGLASLVVIFVLLFADARRLGTKEGWFVVLTLAVFFIPEAPLTMQHGIFLFCFFPLLLLYVPRNAE
jgi:O-antigen ligase